MLSGELEKEECDEENMCEFLLVFKTNKSAQIDFNREINANECRKVLMKAKNSSKLSMFSKRDHAACKCVLHSARIVGVLVHFYYAIL